MPKQRAYKGLMKHFNCKNIHAPEKVFNMHKGKALDIYLVFSDFLR